jgi:hypothetical protein
MVRMVELVGIGTARYIDNTQVIDLQYGQKDKKGHNADSVVQNLYKTLGSWAVFSIKDF